MDPLFRQAMSNIEAAPARDRDAPPSHMIAEVEGEWRWAERFAATADDQWDRLMAEVRRDLAGGGARPLDEVFPLTKDRP